MPNNKVKNNEEVAEITISYMPSSNEYYVIFKNAKGRGIAVDRFESPANALYSFTKAIEYEKEIRAGKRIRRDQKIPKPYRA